MSRRRRLGTLGAGLAALAAGWLLGGGAAPPLYDGGLPAPPYRLLCNPPSGQTEAVAGHREDDPVSGGQSPPLAVVTSEPNVPQAQLLSGQGAFALPPGATTVSVAIEPVPPPTVLPSDGRLDGNVYRFSVSAAGKELGVVPGQLVSVVLRGLVGQGTATIERLDGGSWKRLDTQPVGSGADVYDANVDGLGLVALVVPGTPATPQPCATFAPGRSSASGSGSAASSGGGGSGSGSGAVVLIAALAGGVLLAGTLLVVLRRPGGGDRGGSPGGRTPGSRRRR